MREDRINRGFILREKSQTDRCNTAKTEPLREWAVRLNGKDTQL
jgi:hypothetical protein